MKSPMELAYEAFKGKQVYAEISREGSIVLHLKKFYNLNGLSKWIQERYANQLDVTVNVSDKPMNFSEESYEFHSGI